MTKPLRILHLEDDRDFSYLVRTLLEKEGVEGELVLVSNRFEFVSTLAEGNWDIILADYMLPDYNGLEALEWVRQTCPEVPFLLVSGTIGEQAAIESLKGGATDYVLKQWPERLVPAVRRAVEEAAERKQRRAVETELARHEKYFRALTENALDIVSILDPQGVFAYNSPSVKAVLGYEPRSYWDKARLPSSIPRTCPAFCRGSTTASGIPTARSHWNSASGTATAPGATWRRSARTGWADPDIAGVALNSRDITQRKQTEAELRESEQRYRLIFDGNPTPMLVFDHETLAFLEVNEAAVQHYGYSREEFLGMTLADIRPPEEVPAMIEYLHKFAGAGCARAEGIYRRAGGMPQGRVTHGCRNQVVPDFLRRRMASLAMIERHYRAETDRASGRRVFEVGSEFEFGNFSGRSGQIIRAGG